MAFTATQDDGLRTTPLNLLVGLEGIKMVPHPSAGTSSKHTSLHWEDVKNISHTKHHIVLSCLSGSSTRKRRLCVGTSRCRDTFDLLTSHQKMVQELKGRKIIVRPEPRTLPRPQQPNLQQRSRPVSCNELGTYKSTPPGPRPVSQSLSTFSRPTYEQTTQTRSSHEAKAQSPPPRTPSPARPANAVRIYVPFGSGKADRRESTDEPDITTRNIQVQVDSPVPQLIRMASSPYSSTDRLDLSVSGPSSPRKSTLVRMGTKITADAFFREKMRLQETSFRSSDPSGAYVVGKDILVGLRLLAVHLTM